MGIPSRDVCLYAVLLLSCSWLCILGVFYKQHSSSLPLEPAFPPFLSLIFPTQPGLWAGATQARRPGSLPGDLIITMSSSSDREYVFISNPLGPATKHN